MIFVITLKSFLITQSSRPAAFGTDANGAEDVHTYWRTPIPDPRALGLPLLWHHPKGATLALFRTREASMWLDADCGRHRLYRTEHEKGLASAIAKAPSLLFVSEGRPAYCGSLPLRNFCVFAVMLPSPEHKRRKSYHALDGQVNPKDICGRIAGSNQNRILRGRPLHPPSPERANNHISLRLSRRARPRRRQSGPFLHRQRAPRKLDHRLTKLRCSSVWVGVE
jgi:hypothetical protein